MRIFSFIQITITSILSSVINNSKHWRGDILFLATVFAPGNWVIIFSALLQILLLYCSFCHFVTPSLPVWYEALFLRSSDSVYRHHFPTPNMATQLQFRYLYHFGCSNDRSYFQILPQNSYFVTQTDLFDLKSALNISESVIIKLNSDQHDIHRSTYY